MDAAILNTLLTTKTDQCLKKIALDQKLKYISEPLTTEVYKFADKCFTSLALLKDYGKLIKRKFEQNQASSVSTKFTLDENMYRNFNKATDCKFFLSSFIRNALEKESDIYVGLQDEPIGFTLFLNSLDRFKGNRCDEVVFSYLKSYIVFLSDINIINRGKGTAQPYQDFKNHYDHAVFFHQKMHQEINESIDILPDFNVTVDYTQTADYTPMDSSTKEFYELFLTISER